MRKEMKCLGRFRAFTVLELIVVILIVSGLAALALPRYHRSVLLAHERDAIVQLRTLHEANALHHMRVMRYLPNSYVTNINTINTALGINIIPGAFSYTYFGSDFWAEDVYVVKADYTRPPGFTIAMSNGNITLVSASSSADSFLFPWETAAYASMMMPPPYTSNPCCYNWGDTPCPTLPNCW